MAMMSISSTKYVPLSMSGAVDLRRAGRVSFMKRMSLPSCRTSSFEDDVTTCAGWLPPEASGETSIFSGSVERVT